MFFFTNFDVPEGMSQWIQQVETERKNIESKSVHAIFRTHLTICGKA